MKKPEGFMLYFDRLDPMRDLSNEEIGAVFSAVWKYAESGVIPDLPANLFPFWKLLRYSVDNGTVKYNEISIKNRYNRYKGEVKKSDQEAHEIYEWWATQPDYTPDLFKKEMWYDDAAIIYQRKQSTVVNDGQPWSTGVTNTAQAKHEPITNPTQHEPITNTSIADKTGHENSDYEALSTAWEHYCEMREKTVPFTDGAEIGTTMEQLQRIGNDDPRTMARILEQAIKDRRAELLPLEQENVSSIVSRIAAVCSQ